MRPALERVAGEEGNGSKAGRRVWAGMDAFTLIVLGGIALVVMVEGQNVYRRSRGDDEITVEDAQRAADERQRESIARTDTA